MNLSLLAELPSKTNQVIKKSALAFDRQISYHAEV